MFILIALFISVKWVNMDIQIEYIDLHGVSKGYVPIGGF